MLGYLPVYFTDQHIAHLQQVSQLKICDFSGEAFKGDIIFYECNDDTTALQQ
jgi:hypothetical protein